MGSTSSISPISSITWGKIVVNSTTYKDIKIYQTNNNGSITTQVKEWNWNETGTRHEPGIQISDFVEFIDQVDYIVLSNGMENRLKVTKEAIDYIKSKNKQLIMCQTQKAVEEYNKLVNQGFNVGGLFHSTC